MEEARSHETKVITKENTAVLGGQTLDDEVPRSIDDVGSTSSIAGISHLFSDGDSLSLAQPWLSEPWNQIVQTLVPT
jgi:hypothetical protein